MPILYLPYLCPIAPSNAWFIVGSTNMDKADITWISPRCLYDLKRCLSWDKKVSVGLPC